MSFLSGIPIIGDIIKGVSDYQNQKQKIKAIKNEGAIRLAQTKIEAKIKQVESDSENAGDLDRIALETNGWKDEYLLLIVTVPLIMSFVPDMVQYVEAGFAVLKTMPEYYKWMVGGVYIYVFGYKRIALNLIKAYTMSRLKK